MRGVAIGMIAGLGAGCSSDFSRFAPTSADYTGSINQQQIIHKKSIAPQPFPDNAPVASDVQYDEPEYTGSIENGSIRPVARTVKRTVLEPVAAAGSKVASGAKKLRDRAFAPVSPARLAVSDEPLPAPSAPPAVSRKQVRKVQPVADGLDETMTGAVEPAIRKTKPAVKNPGETALVKPKLLKPSTHGKPVGTSADADGGKSPQPKKVPARENIAVLPAETKPKTKQIATAADTSGKLKIIKSAEIDKTKSVKPVETSKAKPAPGTYTVASGDSLYVIAKKNGTTVDRLKAANGLTDGKLKIGQVLKVPAAGETVVVAADLGVDPIITGSAGTSPKKPAVAPAVVPKKVEAAAPSAAVMEEADKDTAAAPSATGISKLRWPVRGRTLVGFGQSDAGRANDGVDISVPVGTPVKAAENGVVIYAGTGLKDFGNTVLIRHENGLVTVYGHNGDLSVKRGETIKRGQEIARSGMSGTTKVPKLHFEVRKNSKPVNPTTYLE